MGAHACLLTLTRGYDSTFERIRHGFCLTSLSRASLACMLSWPPHHTT